MITHQNINGSSDGCFPYDAQECIKEHLPCMQKHLVAGMSIHQRDTGNDLCKPEMKLGDVSAQQTKYVGRSL